MGFENTVLNKTISAEDVLNILGGLISKNLPKEVVNSGTKVNLTFLKDHSVEINIINTKNLA